MKVNIKSSKFWFILASLIFVVYFFASIPYGFGGSRATEISGNWSSYTEILSVSENNIKIYKAEQLAYWSANYSNFKTKNITLMANIHLDLHYWTPIKEFSGTFDGQGYTISGLTFNCNDSWDGYSGLFKTVNAGIISNVVLKSVNFEFNSDNEFKGDTAYVSALCSSLKTGGKIQNCLIEDVNLHKFKDSYGTDLVYLTSATKCYFGLICAESQGSSSKYNKIQNCFINLKSGLYKESNAYEYYFKEFSVGLFDGEELYFGGIVGYAIYSNIELCKSTMNASVSSDKLYFGGIVGKLEYGTISKSCFEPTGVREYIDGESKIYEYYDIKLYASEEYAGGICGYGNSSVMSYCYNLCNISETNDFTVYVSDKVQIVRDQNVSNQSYTRYEYAYFQGNIKETDEIKYNVSINLNKNVIYNKKYIGGISGYLIGDKTPTNKNHSKVEACYNNGTIIGKDCNKEEIYEYSIHCDRGTLTPAINSTLKSYNTGCIVGNKDGNINNWNSMNFNKLSEKALAELVKVVGSYSLNNCYAGNDLLEDVSITSNITNGAGNLKYYNKEITDYDSEGYSYDWVYAGDTVCTSVDNQQTLKVYAWDINKHKNVYTIKITNNASTDTQIKENIEQIIADYETLFVLDKKTSNYPIIKEMYWKSVVDDSVPPSYSFEWSFNNSDKTATLLKVNISGNLKEIEIPEKVVSGGTTYTVTEIGYTGTSGDPIGAFRGLTSIETVKLPSSVIKIHPQAFCWCINLKTINTENVEYYGWSSFFGCEKLQKVTFGPKVYFISVFAFKNCKSLSEVDLSECPKLNLIDNNAGDGGHFANCTSLKSIKFPEHLTSMPANILSGCSSLQEVTIPFVGKDKNITSASEVNCFGYIFGKTSYTGSHKAEQYWHSNTKTWTTYYVPTSLQKVTILNANVQNNTNVIPSSAFANCWYITSINIPKTVTHLKDGAFKTCVRLKNIDISKVTSIEWEVFRQCESLESVTFNANLSWMSIYAFDSCYSLKEVNLSHCKQLWLAESSGNGNHFANCTSLKSINFPGHLTLMPANILSGCSVLQSIKYNSSLEKWHKINLNNKAKVPGGVFVSCTNGNFLQTNIEFKFEIYNGSAILKGFTVSGEKPKQIEIPSVYVENNISYNVVEIADGVFADYAPLEILILPSTITRIGKNQFFQWGALKTIEFKGTKAQWNNVKKMGLGLPRTIDVKCLDGTIKMSY